MSASGGGKRRGTIEKCRGAARRVGARSSRLAVLPEEGASLSRSGGMQSSFDQESEERRSGCRTRFFAAPEHRHRPFIATCASSERSTGRRSRAPSWRHCFAVGSLIGSRSFSPPMSRHVACSGCLQRARAFVEASAAPDFTSAPVSFYNVWNLRPDERRRAMINMPCLINQFHH